MADVVVWLPVVNIWPAPAGARCEVVYLNIAEPTDRRGADLVVLPFSPSDEEQVHRFAKGRPLLNIVQ